MGLGRITMTNMFQLFRHHTRADNFVDAVRQLRWG